MSALVSAEPGISLPPPSQPLSSPNPPEAPLKDLEKAVTENEVAEDQSEERSRRKSDTDETVDTVKLIDWDSPDDPRKPRNWTSFAKWRTILIVSAFTFISPTR